MCVGQEEATLSWLCRQQIMSSAPTKAKTDYILPNTTSQEIQPSPLALLAATCSKIGTSSTHEQQPQHQEGVPQQQNAAVVTHQLLQQQTPQIRLLNAAVLQQLQAQQQAEGGASVVAGHQAQVTTRDSVGVSSPAPVQQQQQQQQPPQVITLSQLQNFLPIHHQTGQHHVTAVASSESSSHSQQTTQGTAGVKTFVSSAAAVTPTVVSVQGVSGQFLQQQGAQLVTAGGQNLTYNVVQPMQAVTVDGQEALFIPAMPTGQHQAVQLAGSQALITPTGQIIRAPGVYPTGLVQNVSGHTAVQMSNGQNVAVRPANMPQMVQFPVQQTIPVQVPISTANGQTLYQTIHFPVQAFATAIPNIMQATGNQIQMIPQLGQQPAATQSVILGHSQPQQITLAGSQGQQVTVIPASSLANLAQATGGVTTMRAGNNIIQVPNLSNIQTIPLQNIPGLGNVQLIPASALSVGTQNQLGLSPSGTSVPQHAPPTSTISNVPNLPPGTHIIAAGQHIQQDPSDPNKWQVITTTSHGNPQMQQPNIPINNQVTSAVSSESTSDGAPKARVRRVACTCPNCSDGERSGDRKKQHICHIPGCNKEEDLYFKHEPHFFFLFEEFDENESCEKDDKDVWITDGAPSGLYSLKQIQFSQEAATSTQSVSSDGSSSNEEKMMITIQTEADQSDLAISDPLETSVSN
ncbi:hypothetical protein C0J52_12743 [Blattella germanica]|nr:hypothetical protein C0J52_12743 [Blattella germanica]